MSALTFPEPGNDVYLSTLSQYVDTDVMFVIEVYGRRAEGKVDKHAIIRRYSRARERRLRQY
eukprot:392324-Pyramimonas_sp.AAC.1